MTVAHNDDMSNNYSNVHASNHWEPEAHPSNCSKCLVLYRFPDLDLYDVTKSGYFEAGNKHACTKAQ